MEFSTPGGNHKSMEGREIFKSESGVKVIAFNVNHYPVEVRHVVAGDYWERAMVGAKAKTHGTNR